MTPEDEPAGYLGAAADEDDAPYALPPAADDPYGASDDPYGAGEEDIYSDSAASDEPEYALPGASADDEPEYALPAASEDDTPEFSLPGASADDDPEFSLPPQQDDSADYSASDFLASDAAAADAYGTETYDDPYETQEAYDEYGDYEAGSEDDGYYDSLAHDDGLETGMATQTEAGYDTEEFADDDQPKTISQQDAESIIRRITTKRILPPEQQQASDMSRPQALTPSGGGLKIWPILLLLALIGGAVGFVFKDQIFGTSEPITIVQESPKPSVSEQERARLELVKRILTSEAKAFDRQPAELIDASTKAPQKTGAPPATATPTVAKTEEGK